jgi:hypothetical protein
MPRHGAREQSQLVHGSPRVLIVDLLTAESGPTNALEHREVPQPQPGNWRTCRRPSARWLALLGLEAPFIYCLPFGALVSPTDPIAVTGILKSGGAVGKIF